MLQVYSAISAADFSSSHTILPAITNVQACLSIFLSSTPPNQSRWQSSFYTNCVTLNIFQLLQTQSEAGDKYVSVQRLNIYCGFYKNMKALNTVLSTPYKNGMADTIEAAGMRVDRC